MDFIIYNFHRKFLFSLSSCMLLLVLLSFFLRVCVRSNRNAIPLIQSSAYDSHPHFYHSHSHFNGAVVVVAVIFMLCYMVVMAAVVVVTKCNSENFLESNSKKRLTFYPLNNNNSTYQLNIEEMKAAEKIMRKWISQSFFSTYLSRLQLANGFVLLCAVARQQFHTPYKIDKPNIYKI